MRTMNAAMAVLYGGRSAPYAHTKRLTLINAIGDLALEGRYMRNGKYSQEQCEDPNYCENCERMITWGLEPDEDYEFEDGRPLYFYVCPTCGITHMADEENDFSKCGLKSRHPEWEL